MEQSSPISAPWRYRTPVDEHPARAGRLIKERQRAREIEIRIGPTPGTRCPAMGSRNQNRAGLRILHLGSILGVGEKSEVAGPGALHSGDGGNFDFGIAFDAATERMGDFTKSHVRILRVARRPGGRGAPRILQM